jgi:hypothetical protein
MPTERPAAAIKVGKPRKRLEAGEGEEREVRMNGLRDRERGERMD